MIKRRVFLVIVALMSATIACQAVGGASPTSSAPPDIQDTQNTEVVPPTSNSFISRCQLDQWKVIPTDIFVQPDSQGWKYILVQFALMNNSQYWGRPVMDFGTEVFITTEDDFKYSIIPVEVLAFEHPFDSFVESRLPSFEWIPPAFVTSGNMREGRPQMLFKVAESQDHFKLTIPILHFRCIIDGEDIYDESGPVVIDLDTDMSEVSYPTTEGAAINITETIETKAGTFQFQNSVKENDKETFYFKFTNASSGYGALGQIEGYLIGNDGVIRDPCGGSSFEAGPGQSSEVKICFPTTNDAGNRYLVLRFLDANFNPISTPGVYKLP